jgi:xanthine/CO dehydrogenase XdhC/CoxF family maturation factor
MTTMKEQAEIFALYESLRASGGAAVLATVVRTSGSTYRRAGARMLVTGDGRSAGLISGGCLEADLRERSASVFAAGKPLLVTYDSTSPDDILWGLGLGCTGVAHVLLERVSDTEECGVIEFLEECRRTRRACAIAVPYLLSGTGPVLTESRVFFREGDTPGDDGSGLEDELRRACRSALASRKSSYVSLTVAEGKAEAFIEYVPPPVSLFVFGAGPDAGPLVRLAKELGWHVTVADGRPAYLRRELFPLADELLLSHPAGEHDAFTIPRGAAAVIMTHNFNNDVALAGSLFRSPAGFVGLLGPRAKSDMLIARLAADGIVPTTEELARFHSPVGLDIGAETPEEIALAIIAEIQAVLHDRPGTPLRLREGPIHR